MSFVSEVRDKANKKEAPHLVISKENANKLKKGEIIIVEETNTKEQYLLRVKEDCLDKTVLNKEDLEIDKINFTHQGVL